MTGNEVEPTCSLTRTKRGCLSASLTFEGFDTRMQGPLRERQLLMGSN